MKKIKKVKRWKIMSKGMDILHKGIWRGLAAEAAFEQKPKRWKSIDTCKNPGKKIPNKSNNRSIKNILIFLYKYNREESKGFKWYDLTYVLSRSSYYIRNRLYRSKVKTNRYFVCVNILVICMHYIKALYDSPKLSSFFFLWLNVAVCLLRLSEF